MGGIIYIFASISFPVLFLALLFNSLGIFLLKSFPGIEKAQKVIIINLSLSEILIAVGWIGQLVATIAGLTIDDRAFQVIWALRAGVYCLWFANMYILSLDRLMSCIFALKHRAQMSKKRMQKLMTILWITFSVKSILLLIFNTRVLYQIYNTFVWITLDIVAIFIYSLTYISIFLYTLKREKQRRARTHSKENHEKIHRVNTHFMKVVGFIFISFLVFEVVPSITEFSFFANGTNIPRSLEVIIFLSYQLALLADPLIYIFMQSRIRMFLYSKIETILGRNRRDETENPAPNKRLSSFIDSGI